MFFSPETALIAFSALSAFQDGDDQLNLSSQKVKAARAPSSDAFYAAASALHARHSSNSTTHSASTNSSDSAGCATNRTSSSNSTAQGYPATRYRPNATWDTIQLGPHGRFSGADMFVAYDPLLSDLAELFPPDLFYEKSKDRTAIKALVYGLALLDILQTVMVTADAFHWFVYGFSNPLLLDQPFLNSWDVPVLDSVISLIVQAFYCWRIYILRNGVVIPVLILIWVYRTLQVSLAQFAAGIATGVRNYQVGSLTLSREYIGVETNGLHTLKVTFLSKENTAGKIWLAGGAVADVAIAGVLSWTLLSGRNNSLSAHNSMLSRLIRLIVETNALTAGVAVVAIELFWGFPVHQLPPCAFQQPYEGDGDEHEQPRLSVAACFAQLGITEDLTRALQKPTSARREPDGHFARVADGEWEHWGYSISKNKMTSDHPYSTQDGRWYYIVHFGEKDLEEGQTWRRTYQSCNEI
ncbi:hypothetical protein C8J57DRAFT_1566872 [Mycena rebaudengoi]|nr:hypothetical protein C8J57DRAFT_1566872 [Mycena rebaudengoi]